MFFNKVVPPKNPRTDYISDDGRIQLVKDESSEITTRYMAAAKIGSVLICQFGASPEAAIRELRKEALRVSEELRDLAVACTGAKDVFLVGSANEVD